MQFYYRQNTKTAIGRSQGQMSPQTIWSLLWFTIIHTDIKLQQFLISSFSCFVRTNRQKKYRQELLQSV